MTLHELCNKDHTSIRYVARVGLMNGGREASHQAANKGLFFTKTDLPKNFSFCPRPAPFWCAKRSVLKMTSSLLLYDLLLSRYHWWPWFPPHFSYSCLLFSVLFHLSRQVDSLIFGEQKICYPCGWISSIDYLNVQFLVVTKNQFWRPTGNRHHHNNRKQKVFFTFRLSFF